MPRSPRAVARPEALDGRAPRLHAKAVMDLPLMRTMRCVAFLTGLAMLPANAESLRGLPPLLRAISDEVGVLSVSEGTALSRHIARLEDDKGVKIIVVIAETVRPESIERYSSRVLAHWRARSNALDNGRYVLVVVAVKDRELRLTPGSRTIGLLQRLQHSAALDGVPPLLRQKRFYQALDRIVEQLERLAGEQPATTSWERKTAAPGPRCRRSTEAANLPTVQTAKSADGAYAVLAGGT